MVRTVQRDDRVLIQNLAMPDPEICSDDDMFIRRSPGVTLDLDDRAVDFQPGAVASLDTYFNLFNLSVWTTRARLIDPVLRLAGNGRIAVQVVRGHLPVHLPRARHGDPLISERTKRPEKGGQGPRLTSDREVLHTSEIELVPEGVEISLARVFGAADDSAEVPAQSGLVHLELTALDGRARLTACTWLAREPAGAPPVRLLMSVTSFRREKETADTVRRITGFIDVEADRLGAGFDLLVVDNGQSLDLPPHPHLRVVPNANLGGAGGFARGLAEARKGDYTHVLFSDDDASFMVENLWRTIAFLRLARAPNAALAGAMISAGTPWAMWENGAIFDRVCRPQFVGTDLRAAHEIGAMELRSARPRPPNYYGGWWYFAFPLAAVRHDPFPFFVRGDDISFSLANQFEIATINGVVSFQEDFSVKESALTLYLDLRNHLHHHLVHPFLDIGPRGTERTALRFIVRSLVRMHYESATAQLEAWNDVMKGPEFFERNVDMSVRRPEITALIRDEAWRDFPPLNSDAPEPHDPGLRYGRMMLVLLNGLLVPGWRRFGKTRLIPPRARGLIWPLWGAREATFYDTSGTRGYTVRHDKRKGWKILWRTVKTARRWRRDYARLRDAYRADYDRMTGPAFWQTHFAAEQPAPGTAGPTATTPEKA